MFRYTYNACRVLLQMTLFLSLTHKTELILSAPFSTLTWMKIKILLEIFRLVLSVLMATACTRNDRYMPVIRFPKRCGCEWSCAGVTPYRSVHDSTPRRNVMPSCLESSGLERRNTQPTTCHHIPQHTQPTTCHHIPRHTQPAMCHRIPQHTQPTTCHHIPRHTQPTMCHHIPQHTQPTTCHHIPQHTR